MRSTIQACLCAAGALLAIAAFVVGCGCDRTATCLAPEAGGAAGADGESGAGGTGGGSDCPDDPADAAADERCAVWASASSGDDENPGTQALPVRTLSRALELAGVEGGPGRVYACGEVFPEAVDVRGVSLFGGFDCENDWRYVGSEKRAQIEAPPALAAMKLLESERLAFIGDLNVVASDAVTPGASSTAVFALPGSKARFRGVDLIAGNGADGADGEPGHHNGQPAPKGLGGINGADACALDLGLGGLAVKTTCDDGSESLSGQGGDGAALFANDGLDGFHPPDPNPFGKGAGGKGEDAALGVACTAGISGAHGQDGENGFGAAGHGVLTAAGYVAAPGGDGEPGLPGQGGGGGGASLGAKCPAAPFGGAGGGSGASGGCGGKGGKGGQGGGSSIGIALLSKDIYVTEIRILTANGGKGGNGGALQPGGQGGLPGYGGLGWGAADGAKSACAGGVGGKGGNGGNGGGGQGGHSAPTLQPIGIELNVTQPTLRIPGNPGDGGVGGDPAATSQDGVDGVEGAVVSVSAE